MFKHILIPTDGSDLSRKAMRGGIELAKELGARVTGYVCLEEYPYTPYSEVVIEAPQSFVERTREHAQECLSKVKAACEEVGVEFDADTSSFASPWEGIVDAAGRRGCDLIMMASHGRSGISALLLGSETQKVLTHSKIPVLVYR